MWHSTSSSRDRELAAFEMDGWSAPATVVDHDPLESIGTVVAFARNPMTLAQTAYDLQLASRGRFNLGEKLVVAACRQASSCLV